MTRFVIRHPHILTTPRNVAHELGTRARIALRHREARFGGRNPDFFMHYPDPAIVHTPAGEQDFHKYLELYDFFSSNKYQQRMELAGYGLPVPLPGVGRPGTRYVIRPLHHQGGNGWRVTDDPTSYNPHREYLSQLFPKTHEYRIIYVKGKPIIFLKKVKNDPALQADQPWNHGNTHFSTIDKERWATSNLASFTRCFQLLDECSIIRNADYVGVDVLYNRNSHEWCVCEFNSCPALTIEDNIKSVAEAIRNPEARAH